MTGLKAWIRQRVTRPQDDEQARLRRWVMTWIQLVGIFICVAIGVLYEAIDVPVRGEYAIAASFALSIILLLARVDTWIPFTIAVAAVLLGSLVIQWTAGGFAASGANCVWSLAVTAAACMHSPAFFRWTVAGFLVLMPSELALELLVTPPYAPRPSWAPILAAALNIGGVGVLVCSFLAYTFRERTAASEALAHEHARSEGLLLNVLPAVIAERLKHSPGVIADRFEQATILFADVVGFTPLAASMKSEELVGLLDHLFSAFDDLAERYGVEKIKTIGDAYMVAGGVPVPRADAAHATADLALAMVAAAARVAPELGLRIGIHIGPIVAGVIGKKKFAYDLWGDTVNTASRMESHGASGRVHVSAALRQHLGDAFAFTPRGAVVIKGLGAMETFFLERRAAAADSAAPAGPAAPAPK